MTATLLASNLPVRNAVTEQPLDPARNTVTTLSPAGTSTGNTVTEPATDWALVALTRAGDRDAFAELYRRHHGFVYGFAWARLRHRETAEDIASEVFARALRSLDKVQDTGRPFPAWLITIARNAVFDHFKRSSTRHDAGHPPQGVRLHDAGGVVELAFDMPDQRRPLADHVEDRLLLRVAFTKLCPADQEILVHRYLLDADYADLAAVQGRGVNALKSQQHRALSNLRIALQGAA